MQKRDILLSQKLKKEITRIELIVMWYPDILFYNTVNYSTMQMPVEYGVRFGHKDTLRYIHVPYPLLHSFHIDEEWLHEFDRAARTDDTFHGLPFV